MPLEKYLAVSEFIDFDNELVANKAKEIACDAPGQLQTSKACFEFVRDEIKHSRDFKLNPVTCKASDVLKFGTGYCYAKSHLLAALLRANGIPAGLCYQRLTINEDKPPFCIHGLNAVHLPDHGWYRIDARGNKNGVDAAFTPPIENLAFPIVTVGEMDFPEIWPEPSPQIVQLLHTCDNYQQVAANLPDIATIQNKTP
jgi:transglutaminase-like putative cysteine protease